MSNIIQLTQDDPDKILLVKRSLLGLRDCYPGFSEWFDTKIIPNIKDKSSNRRIFLASNLDGFTGALILKKSEKKICTLFVKEDQRFNSLGLDLMRIASEELETYKMAITISESVINTFNNAKSFNFYQTDKECGKYKE